jgi:hypothetical protein
MKNKTCRVCKVMKQKETDFYPKKAVCKECTVNHKRKRRIELKIRAIQYKGGICNDCGVTYQKLPYAAWDFHHINPHEKEFTWSKLKNCGWDGILAELDKCVLLCANCHRVRHCTDCDN